MQGAQHHELRQPSPLQVDGHQHVNSNRDHQQAKFAVPVQIVPLEKGPIPSIQQVYFDAHPLPIPG